MGAKILKIFPKSPDKGISLFVFQSGEGGGGLHKFELGTCHKLTSHTNRPITLVSNDRLMMLQNVNMYTKEKIYPCSTLIYWA